MIQKCRLVHYYNHHGSGGAVHRQHVAMYVQSSGQQACADNGLSPQANGMVERFHRQLKAALCARCSSGDWWSTCPGCCWAFVQHQRRRRECRQLRRLKPLSSAAQSVAATSTCTSGGPGEGGHPQHGEAGQRSGEGARGGSLGGFPRVRAGRSGHRSAGCHIPRPLLCAGGRSCSWR